MNPTIITIAMIAAFIVGGIIGLIVSAKQPDSDRISSVEYQRFQAQAKETARIAHGGGPLIPDKSVYEIIREGAEKHPLSLPKIDF